MNGTGSGPFDRYAIPPDNPFAGAVPGLDEIWAYGLRNPWRISFDRVSGAAVHRRRRPEPLRGDQPRAAGTTRRPQLRLERDGGQALLSTRRSCPLAGDTLPVAEYTPRRRQLLHHRRLSSTAAARSPTLVGQYVFADYCSGKIWTITHGGTTRVQRADTAQNITSFGESQGGELWAVTSSGTLYRVRGT